MIIQKKRTQNESKGNDMAIPVAEFDEILRREATIEVLIDPRRWMSGRVISISNPKTCKGAVGIGIGSVR